MKTKFLTISLILYLFSISLINANNENDLMRIDPNDKSTFPKEEISEVEKISNKKTEEIMANTDPLMSFVATGYLTISTIKNVIVYPFSKNEYTIKIFSKNGFVLLKDSNDVIIFNHKLEFNNEEEIKAFTFINRGNMILRSSKDDRIWPFGEEKMYKKFNVNFKQGYLKVTNEENEDIYSRRLENKNLKVQLEYLAI